jgi:hypothetical protein
MRGCVPARVGMGESLGGVSGRRGEGNSFIRSLRKECIRDRQKFRRQRESWEIFGTAWVD